MTMAVCTHREHVKLTELPDAVDGCEDCLAIGGKWLHLRICLECGHVGCCDDSPNRHASAHAAESEHPIIRSLQPGEDWCWSFVDQVGMLIPELEGNTRIPPSPLGLSYRRLRTRTADGGERLSFAGSSFVVRASADTTGGAFTHHRGVAAALDTPLHVHANEDELFYILEGEHVIQCGEDEFRLGPGGTAFLPRGVPHSQRCVEQGVGRLLVLTYPAGFEGFFRELGAAERAGTLGPETYATASETYDSTWLGERPQRGTDLVRVRADYPDHQVPSAQDRLVSATCHQGRAPPRQVADRDAVRRGTRRPGTPQQAVGVPARLVHHQLVANAEDERDHVVARLEARPPHRSVEAEFALPTRHDALEPEAGQATAWPDERAFRAVGSRPSDRRSGAAVARSPGTSCQLLSRESRRCRPGGSRAR